MNQQKSLKKQDFSFEDMPILKVKKTLRGYNPDLRLKNRKVVAQALWQCLVENDVDSFKEILRSHLELTNKNELAKKAGIPKRTLFRLLSPEGNPTLENLGKIIHQLCA